MRAPKRLWRVRDYFESNCTDEVLEGFETACKRLLEAGVELVEQPLPPAFDGVQETHAAIAQSIIARYSQPDFAAHPERFPPLVATVIRSGLERRAVDYLDAQRRRTTLRDEMHAALAGVDGALLPACPTSPTPASDTGEAIFLAPWSLTGLPALSVPSGRFANGLPQAVQLVGAVGDDGAVLGVGQWPRSGSGCSARRIEHRGSADPTLARAATAKRPGPATSSRPGDREAEEHHDHWRRGCAEDDAATCAAAAHDRASTTSGRT